MTPTYTIVKLDRRSIAGDELWTVVQYVDGVCNGGDHHWVRERYAERAKLLYDAGRAIHGRAPSSVLGAIWLRRFGEPMFESDRDYQISTTQEGEPPCPPTSPTSTRSP